MNVPRDIESPTKERKVIRITDIARKDNSMTDKEHKAAGHIKESTGSWVDPKNYIDTYYMDW